MLSWHTIPTPGFQVRKLILWFLRLESTKFNETKQPKLTNLGPHRGPKSKQEDSPYRLREERLTSTTGAIEIKIEEKGESRKGTQSFFRGTGLADALPTAYKAVQVTWNTKWRKDSDSQITVRRKGYAFRASWLTYTSTANVAEGEEMLPMLQTTVQKQVQEYQLVSGH